MDTYRPLLVTHPLFHNLRSEDESALVLICHSAMSEHCYQPDEEVYLEGTVATQMLMVQNGELKFRSSTQLHSVALLPGTWACEVALWCKWVHSGHLKASVVTETVAMNAAKFQGVAESRDVVVLRRYAQLFWKSVREDGCVEVVPKHDWARKHEVTLALARDAFQQEREPEAGKGKMKMLKTLMSFAH